ncbi:cytochrome P450 monooxygenase [Abortiporus biennis]|nr:cytochrome P450 monooxygenase [Abortiporus biennis]
MSSLGLALPLFCGVWFVYIRWICNKFYSRPPGPKPIPLFGNVLQLPIEFQERTMMKWARQYGPLVYARFLGRHTIMVNSAEIMQDLFAKRGAKYSDRPPLILMNELLGWSPSSAFLPYNAQYKRHRRWMHDALASKTKLLEYRQIQKKETCILITGLMTTPEDYVSHFLRFTAGSVAEIVFGHTVGSVDDTYIRLSEKATKATAEIGSPGSMLVDFIPILKYWPTWFPASDWKRKALAVRPTIQDMINAPYNMVKDQMVLGQAKPSMVSKLIEENSQKKEGLSVQDEIDIKNTAAVLYGAATDTTVNLLVAFLLAMIKYPEVFKKAQEEIDRVVGPDRLPEYEDRDSLKYLNAVIKELYRWHPPLPLAHFSMKEDTYQDCSIPANSMVVPNIWAMTQDSNLYPDPEEFIPERFYETESADSQLDLKNPYNLIFGIGRRQCPGQAFADAGVFYAISNMIATLDISRVRDDNGDEINPPHAFKSGLVHHLLPFQCKIKPRSQRVVKLVVNSLESLN